MQIGLLLPGFSASADDWAIPVQQNLVRELAKHADVRVVALRYPHTRTPYTLDGAQVYPLGYGAGARRVQRLSLWAATLRTLDRLHRESPFALLHAMWADETGALAVWAGRWLKVPVVVSLAGGEVVGLPEVGYGLGRSRFGRWTVRQALQGADVVVAASNYMRGLAIREGIAPYKIHRLPLGVDVEVFTPPASPDQTRARHLVHVGSLVGVKDQATLLRAVSQLPDVTLDIVGDGADRDRLAALAQRLGVAARVRFVGAVRHLDLPGCYHAAALHVLTSLHEGQGMVTLEAAACGVPTISTDVGLLPDEPDMGITVPVGDDAALAGAMDALLGDDDRRRALGESAHKHVRDRYTIQHTVTALLEIYEGLLDG